MVKLSLDQAPAVSIPRRFLLSAPLWGMLAGVLFVVDGNMLLLSRWHPATLALVHAFTLGVLGNVMFGSVLQFLPAAAGIRVYGSKPLGPVLHSLLNFGALMLIAGLRTGWRPGLVIAAFLLPAAFVILGAMTLPGLLLAAGQRLLRAGCGVALISAVLAGILGGCLALGFGGWIQVPWQALTDVHASFGVLGWIIVLIASVARVVMTMFQGTAALPARLQAAWLVSVPIALVAAGWVRLSRNDASMLQYVIVIHVLLFASAALWLQWRAPRPRRGALLWSWQAGLLMLLLAALALLRGPWPILLTGTLGLGIALPLLVNGMTLEIIAFLGWIQLHRLMGRGVQVPGVQRLLPECDKLLTLLAQGPMALLLVAATLWHRPLLARAGGLAMALAWLGLWLALVGVHRRANRFLLTAEKHQ